MEDFGAEASTKSLSSESLLAPDFEVRAQGGWRALTVAVKASDRLEVVTIASRESVICVMKLIVMAVDIIVGR